MEIRSLEYCDLISDGSTNDITSEAHPDYLGQIVGGRLARTSADAQTFEDGAIATASAAAVGTYTKTHTSARTSGRSNRHGSFQFAAAAAGASARLGTETDLSSSSDNSFSATVD